MELLTPSIGFIFWVAVVFILLLILLGKFAWRPIVDSVNAREGAIVDALNQATLARREVEKLRSDNENILREARIKRDVILKEARDVKDQIISDAQSKAKLEADRLVQSAKLAIENERLQAMIQLKNQVGQLSVEIAERLLQSELKDKKIRNKVVDDMLENIKAENA